MADTLERKIAFIAEECAYVQKDGRNDFHKYKYASAAAVLAKVNEAMAKHGICSTVDPEVLSESDNAGNRTVTVKVVLTLHDGDSDATLTTAGIGCGQDKGDKAVMKAQTAAIKYAWMLALNISTGDDPEADEDTDKRNHAAPAQQRPSPTAARPPAQPARPANVDRDGVVAELPQVDPHRAPDLLRGAVEGAVPLNADPLAALWGKVDTAVRLLRAAGITSFQAPAAGADQVTIETFLADARGALANAKAGSR